MIEDRGLDDPILKNDTNCFKKHLMTIIFILVAIVLISVIIVLVFVLSKKDDDKKEKTYEYEFGLNMDELRNKTNPDYMYEFNFLTPNSVEYTSLEEGDKKALKYLAKAAVILQNIHFRIDEPNNIPFKKFLEKVIKEEGNEQAILTKKVFDGQKGINAVDALGHEINLAKGIKLKPGMGVYPEDITKEELHNILIKMLKENKTEEVKNILNQRSIVERDGEYLKAVDYVDFFKDEFSKIADLLDEAAKVSTNSDFNEYLNLQAKAFRKADPVLDAHADIKWAELQDTPLEMTITRESYLDQLTGSFTKNEELSQLLKNNNIKPVPKDSLGFRLGIVNKNGTEMVLGIKQYLPLMAEKMPYNNEYNQSIISNDSNIKQTMVDVDLVILAGDCGAFRTSITLAENLPNDDKLSISMGGGKRNVYHRQIREAGGAGNPEKVKKFLDLILDPDQHQYYDYEADHWQTICHENTHSLGPVIKNDNLAEFSHIIEEIKADLGGLSFLDLLLEKGYYTEEQKNKIIVTYITGRLFPKEEPIITQEHLVGSVIENYYIFTHGGYEIKDGRIHVNIDKVNDIAKEMMKETIRVQLDNDYNKGKKYVESYFKWTDEMKLIAQKKSSISNSMIMAITKAELADMLLES